MLCDCVTFGKILLVSNTSSPQDLHLNSSPPPPLHQLARAGAANGVDAERVSDRERHAHHHFHQLARREGAVGCG